MRDMDHALCAGRETAPIRASRDPFPRGVRVVLDGGRRLRLGLLAALVVLTIPCLILRFGTLPIRLWDESRQAVSALEMLDRGDPLVPTYLGKPDMWNTKPPLLIWLQVASLRLFGLNELAIRLPSALAAFATVLLLFTFCAKALGSPRLGFLAGLVLVSSRGYVGLHVARTGDYDALLTLWTTAYALSFFLFLETSIIRPRPWYLVATAGCIVLAVLTKSISGLLIVPGLVLYAVLRGKVGALVGCRAFIPCLTLFIVLAGGYYALREHRNPGYLAAVLKNDVGGRFLSTIEHHQGPFDFYYARLRDTRFSPWLYFFPLGVAIGLFSQRRRVRELTLYLILGVLVFLVVISAGKTKLEWYDAPMYPLAALVVGIGINALVGLVLSVRTERASFPNTLVALLLCFGLYCPSYRDVFNSSLNPREHRWEADKYHLASFLQSACRHGHVAPSLTVVYDGFDQHLRFYAGVLKAKGCTVSFVTPDGLEEGAVAVASQPAVKTRIENLYHCDVVSDAGDVRIYRIGNRMLPQ